MVESFPTLICFHSTVYLDHLHKKDDDILFVHIVHAPHSRKYDYLGLSQRSLHLNQ